MRIKIYKDIGLVRPVMIAGWPGMGSVALGAVDYMRRKLGAKKFAEIAVDPMSMLDSVAVNEGLAALPGTPRNVFYYSRSPDIVIFHGEAQPHGRAGVDLVKQVIGFAGQLGVSRIYTGAAFPMPVSHRDPPKVFGASNKKELFTSLARFGIEPMEDGHIAGLNGLLVGLADSRTIEAICLLATMPQYAISLPNPKASGSLISVLSAILGLKIDMRGIEEYSKDMDEKMSMIEDKVKDVLVIDDHQAQHVQHAGSDRQKVPAYIIDKIEKLFTEAMSDRSKGLDLKKELDRWDLYRHYEDRFLDLFRGTQ